MRSLFLGALRAPFLSILFAVSFGSSALADQYFETLRYNSTTPAHCQEFDIDFFSEPVTWVTYGVLGATEVGFTNEYPIQRHEAGQAWRYLRSQRFTGKTQYPELNTDRMLYFLNLLEQARQHMGYTYSVEGEILEALALIDLHRYYDPNQYFFTGSIAYSRGAGSSTMGELDIIVARKSDCHVVLIGESKLGKHRLSKAKSQLQRFHNFMRSHHGRNQTYYYH